MLRIARDAIDRGLRGEGALPMPLDGYGKDLLQERASFVTLRMTEDRLRGCIGSSEAVRPLAADVAHNAWAAAFQDPRFQPLLRHEFDDLHIDISVLSPLERLVVSSEDELLDIVRAGVDGLLVQEGSRRGTLLPAVWDALSDKQRFVFEVRRKAGLSGDYWSDTMKWYRYTAESFD